MPGSFNIADFRAVMKKDHGWSVAQPNRFRVRIFMPQGLVGTTPAQEAPPAKRDEDTVRFLEYWAHSVSLPPFGLQKIQAFRYGYGAQENRPVGPVYTDTQVMFICDDSSNIWKFFYNWNNMIFNTKTQEGILGLTGDVNSEATGTNLTYVPYELAYRVEYITDVEIHGFAKTGEQNMRMVLREAFPVGMSGVALSWADNNSFMSLPITFAYTDIQMQFGGEIIDGGIGG